jgi:hypothetical protein
LSADFALALLPPASFALLSRQSIGGGRFGGCGGVLLFQAQLPFQIGDLLFGFGDSLRLSGQLLTELLLQLLYLLMEPLVFLAQTLFVF